MKRILIIIVFSFCQNVFCQEYKFDCFYEYTCRDKDVCFFMLNSSDKNYLFFGNSYNNEITGYIFDYRTVEFHYYNVTNAMNKVTFDYKNSRKIQGSYPDGIDKKIQFDYTLTKIDSLKESVKIVRYKQKKKRDNLAEVELIYDKTNSDFIFHNSSLLFLSHHLFDKRQIEYVNNRLPSSIAYDYYNGSKFTYNLTKKQKINTTLTISKKQLNYL